VRRILAVLAGAVLAATAVATVSANASQNQSRTATTRAAGGQGVRLRCGDPAANQFCAEPSDALRYERSTYTGHDEPALLFYSNQPGSGNNSRYRMVVPKEPPTLPRQNGEGGSFTFQNRVAFWFGMDLCDNQSAPEFTHAPCVPDSDSNIFDSPNPASPHYIGRHPGNGFLELQFYPPGYAPFQLLGGVSCDATKWCAAMALFSFNRDQNAPTFPNQNADCLAKVGEEPANFAFVTNSGVPHAPPAPLQQTAATFTPNPATDLFFNPGDALDIAIHDSPAGLVTSINDRTTGHSGSMTASVANGFAQINFRPHATTCTESPYAFHPMYSTSSPHTRDSWTAHTYNVSFSDEIGHFELCSRVKADGTCASGATDPAGPDGDDVGCLPAQASLLVKIGGCTGTDNDFDGTSYQRTWPGSFADPGKDARLHPTSVDFTSPTFNGDENYSRVGFEADLPRIEAADFGGNCDRTTGANCVNPPPGAKFYPIYTTRSDPTVGCLWQQGGAHIPGTTNTFGGNSTAEFGPLLFYFRPGPGFQPSFLTNNFRKIIDNPCVRAD
jgi:hypothetical protein